MTLLAFYDVTRTGPDTWTLEKADGSIYTVTRGRRWLCTCPDFVYRRQAAGELCKHQRHVIDTLEQEATSDV